jgi:hypothetical protein
MRDTVLSGVDVLFFSPIVAQFALGCKRRGQKVGLFGDKHKNIVKSSKTGAQSLYKTENTPKLSEKSCKKRPNVK